MAHTVDRSRQVSRIPSQHAISLQHVQTQCIPQSLQHLRRSTLIACRPSHEHDRDDVSDTVIQRQLSHLHSLADQRPTDRPTLTNTERVSGVTRACYLLPPGRDISGAVGPPGTIAAKPRAHLSRTSMLGACRSKVRSEVTTLRQRLASSADTVLRTNTRVCTQHSKVSGESPGTDGTRCNAPGLRAPLHGTTRQGSNCW